MRKTKSIFVRGIIFSLIPSLCSYIGASDVLIYLQKVKIIGENVNIRILKDAVVFLGIILTFGLLTYNLIKAEISEEKYRQQAIQLIKYNKDIFVSTLADCLGKEYCDINIRIFVPHKSLVWKMVHLFAKNYRHQFAIKNIEGLAEAGNTNDLRFTVYPPDKIEGLVGECYTQRNMVYDDNLEKSNSTDYHLSEYQINKTRDLKFIIACPTFADDKTIDAVVSFDSKNNIKLTSSNQEKLINMILNYTQQLHENVPELFKAKGGIL